MDIPSTGYVLIPLGLLITLLPWRYCLMGLTTFAVMSPAAVFNHGHFGLQPGYYLSILLSGRGAAEIVFTRYRLNAYVVRRMQLLLYFTIAAFAVLFVALCFFQGQVECLPGTAGFHSNQAHPYHLARENFTQLAYLLINVSIVYVMGQQGAKVPFDRLVRDWDRALACAVCFAAIVCVWQWLSLYKGVWFPDDFFYSNAGYNRADSQSMVGLFRINGPFEEPSVLGYVMSGYLLYAWTRYRSHPSAFSVGMITIATFSLIASTSTTAYIGILLVGGFAVLDFLSGRLYLLNKDYKFSNGQIAAISVILVTLIGASIFVMANANEIGYLLKEVVFNKSESGSFHERAFADELGIVAFVQTYGVGLGLGSHKANSMLVTLLSNVGIVGTLLFIAFVVPLVFTIRRSGNPISAHVEEALRPFRRLLLGLLLIGIITSSNLSIMTMWLGIGGLVAFQASLHRYGTPVVAERSARLLAALARGSVAAARLTRGNIPAT